MEEILSSIKRIIAEEGDEAVSASQRRERRAPSARKVSFTEVSTELTDEDEILELTDSLSSLEGLDAAADPVDYVEAIEAAAQPAAVAPTKAVDNTPLQPRKRPAAARPAAPEPAAVGTEPASPIVSVESETATRSSLAALSSMLVKPADEAADNTLEGLVREMLRPMLKDWLDANLPGLVEGMVAKEIARITGRSL